MSRKDHDAAHKLRELLEAAGGLNSYGVMAKPNMARMRALCPVPPVYTPERVVAIRTTKARMSQAVFAAFLNVSVSTVQKWESPAANKRPSGAAARLLQLIERKGPEALLV